MAAFLPPLGARQNRSHPLSRTEDAPSFQMPIVAFGNNRATSLILTIEPQGERYESRISRRSASDTPRFSGRPFNDA
jgi:hypothetical protein